MSVMTAQRTGLPDDRPLTVEDLDLMPDDGNRYELDDGVIVMSPAPANVHQLVVARLQMMLGSACPAEYVVVSGNGVAMSASQYRIPDLLVIRADEFRLTEKSVSSPPDLAIEVASPSTAIYDRNRKKDVYASFGISWYWIMTPSLDRPRLTCFELRRGSYRQVTEISGDEAFKAERPFPVTIVPAELVALPGQR